MTLLFWIVRILVILLIVRFVVTMVRQAMVASAGRQAPPRGTKRPTERLGGTLVQDPQCGTYLPRDRALAVSAGGSTQYFCSEKCRDEWSARRR